MCRRTKDLHLFSSWAYSSTYSPIWFTYWRNTSGTMLSFGALTKATVVLMKLENNSLSRAPTSKVTYQKAFSSEKSAITKQLYFKLHA